MLELQVILIYLVYYMWIRLTLSSCTGKGSCFTAFDTFNKKERKKYLFAGFFYFHYFSSSGMDLSVSFTEIVDSWSRLIFIWEHWFDQNYSFKASNITISSWHINRNLSMLPENDDPHLIVSWVYELAIIWKTRVSRNEDCVNSVAFTVLKKVLP